MAELLDIIKGSPDAEELTGTELFQIVQKGSLRKVSVDTMRSSVLKGDPGDTGPQGLKGDKGDLGSGGGGSGGGGLTTISKATIDNGAVLSTLTAVYADTTVGQFTLKLPAAPTVGDHIQIIDAGNYFPTNNLTIDRNGMLIAAQAADLTIDTTNVIDLYYQSVAYGWRVDVGSLSYTPPPQSGIAFSATKNAVDQTGVLNNTTTLITFGVKDWDTAGCYDITTSRFQPTVPGKYLVVASMTIVYMTAGKTIAAILKKNGVSVSNISIGSGNDWPVGIATYLADMNGTTDYIEAYIYQETGSTVTVSGNKTNTYFQATMVAAAPDFKLVPYSPTDITGRATDYPLRAGETVFKTFSAATSVPLYVATQEGEYEITILGDTTVAATTNGAVTLKPNNAFIVAGELDYLDQYAAMVTTDGSAPATVLGYKDGTTMTSFTVGSGTIVRSVFTATTITVGKIIMCRNMSLNTGGGRVSDTFSEYWANTTTAWTSLGTLTFPFAQSGKIIVKRIL